MENFDRYGFSRHDLNARAAHSLCRAGWMLPEINGVLQNSDIGPDSFQLIQKHASAFDQLQRKFGPPPTLTPINVSSSTDIKVMEIDTSRLPTMRVMNRGLEEAAAVLSHHGWHFAQIRSVLKTPTTPLENLGLALIHELQQKRPIPRRTFQNRPLHKMPPRKSSVSAFQLFIILFWFGMLIFIGVSLIVHIL
ncbi:MAG: hypothetical protein KTR27_16405 [Leptolyngbyaceae cyanobacterium MAG.088]|nr:hypothetical protein [Leptolyngbyaceae cyanobacterium MAG.088]